MSACTACRRLFRAKGTGGMTSRVESFTGTSQVTGRPFNLIVAFEHSSDQHGNMLGRAIAESSFHHLVDYNWNISMGAPSFVEESPGDQIKKDPAKLDDIKVYVRNVAHWLAG